MNIAIDISAFKRGRYLQHRVRGTGFYIKNLQASLEKYYPENKYIYFSSGDILDGKIDVVHYPYFEPFFLTLPLFNKYKTVVTVHDLTPFVFPKEFPGGLKGRIKWQIQKQTLKSVNAIITDSVCSKNDIVKHTGISSSKINVVYLAASSEFKKREKISIFRSIRKKYNLPEEFVLYVGDATWNKNLPRLLKAIQKINVPLVMVGKALLDKTFDKTNPWNKDLVEIERLVDDDKKIIRLGFVPKEDLILLYNIATVFAMPSIYEGFGLPVLEAMVCGCPVVTSKGGSLAEIAEEACRYVDAYDIDSIAEGISEVFDSKSLQQELSKKGLVQSKKFTWEKTANGTMNVYEKVMGLR